MRQQQVQNAIYNLHAQGATTEQIVSALQLLESAHASPPTMDPPGLAEDGAGVDYDDRSQTSDDEVDWEEVQVPGLPSALPEISAGGDDTWPSDGEIERIMARSFATYLDEFRVARLGDLTFDDQVMVRKNI